MEASDHPTSSDGKMFDGKIVLIPCTKDYITQRKSQYGMKGTLIQVNINVDSGFYTEMWCEKGGVLDQIEGCGVWPKGSRVTAQHDGAKAHTEETVKGTIEDSSFTGDGKDDVRVDVVQRYSSHRTLQTPISGILGPSMPTRRNSRDWKLSPILNRE